MLQVEMIFMIQMVIIEIMVIIILGQHIDIVIQNQMAYIQFTIKEKN